MPLYDRRTLEGVYSVEQTAQMLRHYRYAEEQMMRVMAGWIALTPELAVKLEFGRQVWDCAQHADILGQRLPELRSRAQVSEPPNEAFVTFMTMLADREQPEETIERLVGIFRVLKPHLLSVYAQHLSACNPVYEPPTIRILERLVHETQDHILKGQILLEDLACTVLTRERADEITHVRMGSTWMRQLTEDDPARRQMALDFQHHIDELFNFGGGRQDGPADQVSISISREARKMAGFSDEEIDRLVQAASASVAY